jgi:hypothetical protein
MNSRSAAYHWLRPDLDSGLRLAVPAALASIDLCCGAMLGRVPAATMDFSIDGAQRMPPHWIGERIPLVSALFIAALREAGVDNFQTFPARLRCLQPAATSAGHVAFNAIGLVDCADRLASVGTLLTDDGPGPRQVDYAELVLSRSRTRDLRMFRLADCAARLLVDDRVMEALLTRTPDEGWGFSAIEIELR